VPFTMVTCMLFVIPRPPAWGATLALAFLLHPL
jgi:hypothetical protein